MAPAFTDVVTIDSVDREIASKSWRLGFPPAIEASFEAENAGPRKRMIARSCLVGIFFYDLFLIDEWQIMHDVFGAMAVVRLGLVTPVAVLITLFISRAPNRLLREGIPCLGSIYALVMPMLVLFNSASPYRQIYLLGNLVDMVFPAVIMRIPFVYSAILLSIMFTIQCVIGGMYGIYDSNSYNETTSLFFYIMIFLLFAAYTLEASDRRQFLLALRGRLLHDQLEASARVDPLSKLYNRRHMTAVVDRIWQEARVAPRPVAAILLDIDHFKAFNDRYGHLGGDDCIAEIARSAAEVATRHGGIAVRFGGEEILLVLPGADLPRAHQAAEALRAAIHRAAIAHEALGEKAIVTASFGVAADVAPFVAPADLFKWADAALYAAKHAGRDRVCRHEPLPRAPPVRPAGDVPADR